MKVTGAQVSVTRTINLDNYESAKLAVTFDIESDELTAEDMAEAWDWAKAEIKEQAAPLLEARRRIRSKKWMQVIGGLPRDLRDIAEQILQETQQDIEGETDGD